MFDSKNDKGTGIKGEETASGDVEGAVHGDDTLETASLRCPGDSDHPSESLDIRQGQIISGTGRRRHLFQETTIGRYV